MAGGVGCRDERRGSSASEVGTVDGTEKKSKKSVVHFDILCFFIVRFDESCFVPALSSLFTGCWPEHQQ